MGGWVGGQAEYVLVPYADWNLLKFPDKDQAMEKILDLTMLSDIFPTGYHGAYTAGVDVGLDGLHRRRRPGRPRGRALGAAARRGGRDRRRPDPGAPGAGAQLRLRDRSTSPRATRRTRSSRSSASPRSTRRSTPSASRPAATATDAEHEAPATVLNSIMDVTRAAGKLGIPGLYVTGDPGAADEAAKEGSLSIRIGLGWAKSHCVHHRPVPGDEVPPRPDAGDPATTRRRSPKAVNATVITLDEAPKGYKDFDSGVGQEVRARPARD